MFKVVDQKYINILAKSTLRVNARLAQYFTLFGTPHPNPTQPQKIRALKNAHSNFCKMSCQTQSIFMFCWGLPFVLVLVLLIILLLCLQHLPICEAAKNNDYLLCAARFLVPRCLFLGYMYF